MPGKYTMCDALLNSMMVLVLCPGEHTTLQWQEYVLHDAVITSAILFQTLKLQMYPTALEALPERTLQQGNRNQAISDRLQQYH